MMMDSVENRFPEQFEPTPIEPPKNPNVVMDLIRWRASVIHNESVPETFTPEEMRFVLHLLDERT